MSEHGATAGKCPGVGCSCYGNTELHNLPSVPRCVAHGTPACSDCSRITLPDVTDDGECRGCSTWGTEGIHWDTCPSRIRGPVYETRAAALAGLRSEQTRRAIRSLLIDYAMPTNGGPTWEALNRTTDALLTHVVPPDATDGAA